MKFIHKCKDQIEVCKKMKKKKKKKIIYNPGNDQNTGIYLNGSSSV